MPAQLTSPYNGLPPNKAEDAAFLDRRTCPPSPASSYPANFSSITLLAFKTDFLSATSIASELILPSKEAALVHTISRTHPSHASQRRSARMTWLSGQLDRIISESYRPIPDAPPAVIGSSAPPFIPSTMHTPSRCAGRDGRALWTLMNPCELVWALYASMGPYAPPEI